MNAPANLFTPPSTAFAEELSRLVQLWSNLRHIKWNRETFKLLIKMTEHLIGIAKMQVVPFSTDRLVKLKTYLDKYMSATSHLQQEQQFIITSIMEELAKNVIGQPGQGQVITHEAIANQADWYHQEIVLLLDASDEAPRILARLQTSGLEVFTLTTQEEARIALTETRPTAIIVDTDFPATRDSGIRLMRELREQGVPMPPIFFLSAQADFNTRLQAVRAGGSGFFVRPVDVYALTDRLNHALLQVAAPGYRVLTIARQPLEWLLQPLPGDYFTVRTLANPNHVIQVLHDFQPELVVIDLDSTPEPAASELIPLLRQTEGGETLRLIVCAQQEQRLDALRWGADDFISPGDDGDRLRATLQMHAQQARAWYSKCKRLDRTDVVSGLANRQFFMAQLIRTCTLASDAQPAAVVLILLDNLRELRARHTIFATDQLVEQAARRLQSQLPAGAQAGRLSEALFAVLLPNADPAQLLEYAQQWRHNLEGQIYAIDKQHLSLRTSIGIRRITGDDTDSATVIREADLACTLAKEKHETGIHLYQPRSDQPATQAHQAKLLDAIQYALDKEQLQLVFQPIIHLHGDRTARYEVLLRLWGRSGEELLPESVFAILQQQPVSIALDRWVVEQTVRAIRKARQSNPRLPLQFFVNVCGLLHSRNAGIWLTNCLNQADVYPGDLVFEINEEDARACPVEVQQFIHEVQAIGCRVLLDHFGKQSDAHRLLETLPVNYVKLYRGLINRLSNPAERENLKRLVSQLAARNQHVIIGGVEQAPVLATLWSCGVSYVQGFFVQPPHETMDFNFNEFDLNLK